MKGPSFLSLSFPLPFLPLFNHVMLYPVSLQDKGCSEYYWEEKRFSSPVHPVWKWFPDYSMGKNVKLHLHSPEGGIYQFGSLPCVFHSLGRYFWHLRWVPGLSGYVLVWAGPLPHSPKFSPEFLELIEFRRFGFDELAFSYKDFWTLDLEGKILVLRKLILLKL